MAWAETQIQTNLSSNPFGLPTSPSLASKIRVSKLSPQSEMQAMGLHSSILSPFREPQEDQQYTAEFLPNTTQIPLDPYSEEYHNALVNALKLDTELYAHVYPKLLSEFKVLLRKHPTAFWLPGNPLTEVKGFEHHIETENSLPVYKHP